MKTQTKIKPNIHPACRNFVEVVEALLKQRQIEAAQLVRSETFWREDDWGPRIWTRTELEYMVYSSYKQMRNGRITAPRAAKRSWKLRTT